MKIRVSCRGEITEIQQPAGARLLDYLQGAGIPVNAACGGNGTCHKCRVKVEEGFLGVTSVDQLAFREGELKNGWRLSCQSRPKTNVSVFLPGAESVRSKPRVIPLVADLSAFENEALVLACDLGSTGVVVAIAHKGGPVLLEAHLLNKQVPYGADVMTRLHFAQTKGVEPLRKVAFDTIRSCVKALRETAPKLYDRAAEGGVFCAGNSAMASFLNGWNIETLAVSPFQPALRDAGETSIDGLSAHTLPLLAGFVGGDTVAGILAIEKRGVEEPWMLVDIGTNTEVVINNGKGELWFSSAPAGPAFEGGNINQGMRAESGAISVARYDAGKKHWDFETIGGDIPRGICGSGLIDLLAESVKGGLITPDGFVEGGRLDLVGDIALLADDVREFQLAKSATRTAADLLIQRAGVKPRRIYLAGTFAQHLRLDSVAGVGLLPEGIPAEAIGNASLEGAVLYASMSVAERATFIARLEKMRRPVELALQDDFQDAFVKNLDFKII